MRQKLLLVGLLAGLPFALAGITLGTQAYNQYLQAQKQSQVASNYLQLQNLQKNLRYMRGTAPQNVDPQLNQQVKDDMATVAATVAAANIPEAQRLTETMQAKVKRVTDLVDGRVGTAGGLSDQINLVLNEELLSLFTVLAQTGNLYANSQSRALGLVELASESMPVVLPESGRYIINTVEVLDRVQRLQRGERTEEQRAQVEADLTRGRDIVAELQRESDLLFQQYPDLGRELKPSYDAMYSDLDTSLRLMFNELVVKSNTALTVDQALDTLNPTLESQYAAFENTTRQLNTIYEQQRSAALNRLLLILLGLLAVATLIYALTQYIIGNITGRLGTLTQAAQELSRGNYGQRIVADSQDEIGTLSNTFNVAAEQLEENDRRVAQERLEQEQLQNNIGQFLDVTMDIADGDLTKRGVVTEDVLGNVVDSINFMTEELGSVLTGTRSAAESVTAGSHQMLSTTDTISSGTVLTAQSAQRVAEQTEEVNRQIQAMSEIAQQSAQAALDALLASNEGQQAVQATLSGMQGIRETAQNAEQRIAALSDRSRQIGQIVDTISSIASQTNLLSLHASIEAAGAGEAGERFSVVADEVRQLADESAQASRQIAGLIAGIQREIAEVVQTMRENAEQVNQGYQVAGTAGQRLEQISTLSRESARLAEQISLSTRDQVENIEQVSASVQDIAQIAERSQESVQQGRAAAEQLQQLADQLNASLSRFRLPS
ncbi:methyl-accepting chemotaxis protein [Deinococcus radiophilus]|uniref:methyl-accepting chemotaxis protein n=1 Tax=Deinococcus radiophilus TaxID=32062 RepID=UPI003620785C